MPMKEILQRLQPMQLYIVLALSAIYFLFQLFLSHTTHSLTLLVDSYHMLCNIIALTGCILTIKHGDCKITTPSSSSTSLSTSKDESLSTSQSANKDKESKSSNEIVVDIQLSEDINKKKNSRQQQQHERSLKNTFGWARIDILTMLIVCTFMASLCFSSLVEAIQTLCHIHHQDAMHNPIWVLMLGILGLVLNGLCYLMIGGYTYHQGSFLHITSSGAVILDHVATGEAVRHGERRLSRTRKSTKPKIDEKATKRESVREMFRDVCSTVCVIVCALVVFMIGEEPTLVDSHDDSDSAEALISTVDPSSESLINDLVQHGYSRFVDPIGAIISCIVLLYLSYPYMKESGLILLQTIPATIDIEEFKKNLLESFTEILNVHDLHIWQLNASKYVSTAHIIFHDQKVYTALNDAIINYFHAQGIEKVTIQPEFQSILPTSPLLINKRESGASIECLMQCQEDACFERHCCKNDEAFKKIAEAKNSTKCAIKTTNGGVENKATKVEISLPNTRKPTIIETNEIKTSDLKTDS